MTDASHDICDMDVGFPDTGMKCVGLRGTESLCGRPHDIDIRDVNLRDIDIWCHMSRDAHACKNVASIHPGRNGNTFVTVASITCHKQLTWS